MLHHLGRTFIQLRFVGQTNCLKLSRDLYLVKQHAMRQTRRMSRSSGPNDGPPKKRLKPDSHEPEDSTVSKTKSSSSIKKETSTKAPKLKKVKVTDPDASLPVSASPRATSLWKVGAHVSASGGVENAISNAAAIGANAFALFLKPHLKWDAPPLKTSSISLFKERMVEYGYEAKHVLPHGNYLVNLGNPDVEKREKSYQCFVDELRRCEQLGLTLFNFHPGSTVGEAEPEESIALIAQCLNRAHRETNDVVTVIENMAGAGNVIGSTFEEIAAIIELVEDKLRVGVCLDTCHMFAAGYDIRTKEEWEDTMTQFTEKIGLKYLRGMHLNDSKTGLGSNRDRHENIGLGTIGLAGFRHIVTDRRVQNIPLILETPSFERLSVWRKEIEVLYRVSGVGLASEQQMPNSETQSTLNPEKSNPEKTLQNDETHMQLLHREIQDAVNNAKGEQRR
ncbi:xylose isomerase-like protein, partial [Mycena floridula]